MEQGPQPVEAWYDAAAGLREAARAFAEALFIGIDETGTWQFRKDSCLPPLTQEDAVYIDNRCYSLAGWQLNPNISPDYTWGARNPTRYAVGVDGQLYAAWWNSKHEFVPADLRHYGVEDIQWMTAVVEAHTADVTAKTDPTNVSERHLGQLFLRRFAAESFADSEIRPAC